nr:LysR substrate-binding domain-containing protein [Rubrobacter marinus]
MSRHAGPHGRLAVGSLRRPGAAPPQLAAEYSRRYPEVTLDARVADTEETVALILEREVEVALVGARRSTRGSSGGWSRRTSSSPSPPVPTRSSAGRSASKP